MKHRFTPIDYETQKNVGANYMPIDRIANRWREVRQEFEEIMKQWREQEK